MNFEKALTLIKEGKKLQRKGWNGKNMYICIQNPNKDSKMTLPYLYIITAQNDLIPWVVSHSDLLADDWIDISDTKRDIEDMSVQEIVDLLWKEIPEKVKSKSAKKDIVSVFTIGHIVTSKTKSYEAMLDAIKEANKEYFKN